jgi:acetolactate synthase-1/2/3 large subunit
LKTVDVIAAIFKREGIDRIFGIPGGGSTMHLIHAAKRAGIEVVLTAHEASAALIASVYGEIKEKPGVCFAIKGPGATNLASGVAYAYLERASLLAITEQHDVKTYQSVSTQKIDQRAFFDPITKGHDAVTAPRAQQIVEKAISLSKAERPGPVHLDLAKDEAVAEATYDSKVRTDAVRPSSLTPQDLKRVSAVSEKIAKARHPLLIAGIEAKRGGAKASLTSLAERWNTPVMVSIKGRGVFDENHPLYGGVFLGTFTQGTFEDKIIARSDLLILIGVDGIELLPKPWGLTQPLVHIGFQPNIDAIYPSEIELSGDIGQTLEALLLQCPKLGKWDTKYLAATHKTIQKKLCGSTEPLPLHRIIQITRNKLPSDGILATDVGAFNSMVHYLWQVNRPNTYFTSKGLSTMGIALPAGIAAQLAFPDKKVVCFTGDGGALMRLQDLEICSRLKLPIIIVVFSDNALGLIEAKQKEAGYDPAGVKMKNPDFSKLVTAFGGLGFRVKTEAEFARAIEQALNESRLSLIEAVMNPRTYGDHLKLIRG